MVSAYERRAGVTPTFPLILHSDGGDDLQKLFDKYNYGGPTWMCHPKLFYESTSYSESTLTRAIDAALNDDCVSSHISLEKGYFNSEKIQIYKNKLALHVESNTQVEVRILSLNGKIIHSQSKDLNKGINKFTLENRNIAKGFYILNIKSDITGINFSEKVEFK
jgi:hypothetical protein